MTVLEERLRAGLQRFDPLILREIQPPRWPDRYVFGDPYELGPVYGWGGIRCYVHLAGWEGPGGCWCCAAGIPGVTA